LGEKSVERIKPFWARGVKDTEDLAKLSNEEFLTISPFGAILYVSQCPTLR
jgi:hypothetical protein